MPQPNPEPNPRFVSRNPLFGVLGDIAFPLLVIGGLLFLRSRGPAGGGIPGFGNQGKAKRLGRQAVRAQALG